MVVDKELKAELVKIQRSSANLVKLLSQFERLSAKAEENAYTLDDLLNRMKKLSSELETAGIAPKMNAWIDRTASDVSALKNKFRHDFARRLQELLSAGGHELGGRYPDLKIRFYTIHVDFSSGTASLSFGHEPVQRRIALTPENVLKAIEGTDRALNRSFDAVKFVTGVYDAYERACRIRAVPLGEKVPTIEVLQQLVFLLQSSRFLADPSKEHFRGYGRANFGYDLFRLRHSGARTKEGLGVGLSTATFDATRKRENFIWVPDNERGDGTTYSLIFFRKG